MLLLNFSLLRFDMLLGLLIGGLGVLHMVANHIASRTAECAADRSAGEGRSYCRADNRTADGSDARAAERPFLACRERLSRASGDREKRHQCQCCRYDRFALHDLFLQGWLVYESEFQPLLCVMAANRRRENRPHNFRARS
jgi:hypothetical protein